MKKIIYCRLKSFHEENGKKLISKVIEYQMQKWKSFSELNFGNN